MNQNNTGMKWDLNKPRISLIPSDPLYEIAKVFTHEASKNAGHDFKAKIAASILVDEALRCLLKFNQGEDVDSESGNSNLSRALASIAMLVYNLEHNPETDNRYKGT